MAIQFTDIREQTGFYIEALGKRNVVGLMRSGAQSYIQLVENRLDQGLGAGGSALEPVKRPGTPLILSRLLRASYQATSDSSGVVVENTVPYFTIHQNGIGVRARPTLSSTDALPFILEALTDS